jgi:hypothetical protein
MQESILKLAQDSYHLLSSSPSYRNTLMSLPKDLDPAVTLDTVLQFYLGTLSSFPVSISKKGSSFLPIQPPTKNSRTSGRDHILKSIFEDDGLKVHLFKKYPQLNSFMAFGKKDFLKNILGPKVMLRRATVSPFELFQRLQAAEDMLSSLPSSAQRFYCNIHGTAWINCGDSRKSCILEIESRWPEYLKKLSTNKTLDQLAGVEVPMKSTEYQPDDPTTIPGEETSGQIVSLQLRGKHEGSRLKGTAFKWDFPFSERFCEFGIENGLLALDFMTDPHSDKDRLIRVESPNYYEDSPIVLQYGQPPNAKLYKSTLGSKWGDMVLKIFNWLGTTMQNFIYSEIEKKLGPQVATKWTPPHNIYDATVHVVTTGHSSYAYHDDGKNMLTDPAIPGFEKENMVVPTLVFQNISDGVASVKFCDPLDRNKEVGSIICQKTTLHVQLRGIQSSLRHGVFINNKKAPLNFQRYGISGRSTVALQLSGMANLKVQQKTPPLYAGERYHYVLQVDRESWFDPGSVSVDSLGKSILKDTRPSSKGSNKKPKLMKFIAPKPKTPLTTTEDEPPPQKKPSTCRSTDSPEGKGTTPTGQSHLFFVKCHCLSLHANFYRVVVLYHISTSTNAHLRSIYQQMTAP